LYIVKEIEKIFLKWYLPHTLSQFLTRLRLKGKFDRLPFRWFFFSFSRHRNRLLFRTPCWDRIPFARASGSMLSSNGQNPWSPGVNFTNILRAGLVPADHKSAKQHWWLDYHFALLGYAYIKASRKHVGEIDPRRPLRWPHWQRNARTWRRRPESSSNVTSNLAFKMLVNEENPSYFLMEISILINDRLFQLYFW